MKVRNVRIKHGRYYYLQTLDERSERTGRHKRKWLPLSRVDAGEAALHQALAELLGGPQDQRGNFGELLASFQAEHLPQLSVSAREEYRRNYAVIAKAFAEFDVDQVTTPDVRRFLFDNFAQAHHARRHYKARLSTFFRWCVENQHCLRNPASWWMKNPPRTAKTMDASAFHALRDALPPIGQVFIDLLFLTQQRPTEIRLLRWSQIRDELIRFTPTKTERSSGVKVSVPVTPAIAAVLERARQLGRIKALGRGDAFVIQAQGGGSFSVTGIHSMWRRAAARAGIHGLSTRSVRPYALTEADRLGYSLKQLREAAAHTTVATTEGYIAQYREVVSQVVLELPARPK